MITATSRFLEAHRGQAWTGPPPPDKPQSRAVRSCRCGTISWIGPKKRVLLNHVKDGHSVQHGTLFCAEIERWPKAQRLKSPTAQDQWNGLPVPMLFIEMKALDRH